MFAIYEELKTPKPHLPRVIEVLPTEVKDRMYTYRTRKEDLPHIAKARYIVYYGTKGPGNFTYESCVNDMIEEVTKRNRYLVVTDEERKALAIMLNEFASIYSACLPVFTQKDAVSN